MEGEEVEVEIIFQMFIVEGKWERVGVRGRYGLGGFLFYL